MTTEGLEQSFATMRGVLTNVKPNQLDDDTPCQSWKVRDLINHVVGGSQWFGATMNAGESQGNPADVPDLASGDYMSVYDDGVTKSVDAFNQPGAKEKVVKLPFGEFPGAAFMGLATTDQFTHAWDLAKATGQDTDLNPKLAEQLLEASKANIQPGFRGEEPLPFGPEVECDDSAPAADRLAAFLGRTV